MALLAGDFGDPAQAFFNWLRLVSLILFGEVHQIRALGLY